MKEKESIKVLLDHQIFSLQRYGGISRKFVELYKRKKLMEGIEINLPIISSSNEYLIREGEESTFKISLPSFLQKRFYLLFNNAYVIYKMIFNDYHIFQSTYYLPYFLPYLRGKPFVITIYDMIHEKFPGHFGANNVTIRRKKKLIKKADSIVAISENTKRDIVNFYNISEEKVKVIHLATGIKLKKLENPPLLPKKYILFVGRRGAYKNYEFLLKAITQILLSDENLCLLSAGGGKFSKEEEDLIKALGVVDKVKQFSFKTDRELAYIYNQALFFVFPSIYEGFGIPILEAFACNCPVACSDRSSFPEVAGNAALFFNPEDAESIRNCVTKLLNNSKLRKTLIIKGRERGSEFSWEKSAIEYAKVYREIYESRKLKE